MGHVQVRKIVDQFQLEVLSGREYLDRQITTSDLYRPGLEMAGYFNHYPANRIQILGRTELSFLERLPSREKELRLMRLCAEETPCILIARGMSAPPELLTASRKKKIPILISRLTTTRLISRLTHYLEGELAPQTIRHGVLVDIYGIGVLLTGQSGIGKSETALELVKRGHRLIADDVVVIRQPEENLLVGTAPELTRHLLEIRGVGIINVMTLFGAGAVRNFKKLSMVCCLESWDETRAYDRLGLDENQTKILDTYLPEITIPVRPGRNLAVIVEVAAMNYRLKRMGFNAAEGLAERLTAAIEEHDDRHDEI